jgi:catechol 2,3-dioxygenase
MFGLAVLDRRADRVYMASGKTTSYEVEFIAGGNVLDHFAFGVCGVEALEEARERLTAAGGTVEDTDAETEPGLAAGIAFTLPSGHALELVALSAPSGFITDAEATPTHHRVTGPLLLEHIALLSSEIRATSEFLIEHLGWRITDSWQPSPDEPWRNTWLRAGELHHDLALLPAEGSAPELHHFAFAVPAVADLVRVSDALAARGMVIDSSIGRHIAGNNVFLYFKDPFGNRCETNAEMARIDPAAPPRIVRESFRFDAWREGRPPALTSGSPCRDASTIVSQRYKTRAVS